MKLYLHIGYNKTGTSSIQAFCNSHRKELSEHGIVYPESGVFSDAHYGISSALTGNPPKQAMPESLDPLPRLVEELQSARPGGALISSEFFINARAPQVRKISNYLSCTLQPTAIKIIVYLRRHDLWFESLFNQAVKDMDSPTWQLDIDEFVLGALGHKRPEVRYLKVLDRWARYFGQENLIVRPFEAEQFLGGNLIKDFLSIFDRDVSFLADNNLTHANESVASGPLYLVGLLRRIASSEHRNRLIGEVLANPQLEVPFAPKDFGHLTPAVRQSIVRFFEDEYAAIAKIYLNRPDGKLFRHRL